MTIVAFPNKYPSDIESFTVNLKGVGCRARLKKVFSATLFANVTGLEWSCLYIHAAILLSVKELANEISY